MSRDKFANTKPLPDKTVDKHVHIPSVRSTSERGAPGCRRMRQTGVPSEVRYETHLELVRCWAFDLLGLGYS